MGKSNTAAVGDTVAFQHGHDGEVRWGTVESRTGGWTTVMSRGDRFKIRNSAVIAEEAGAVAESTSEVPFRVGFARSAAGLDAVESTDEAPITSRSVINPEYKKALPRTRKPSGRLAMDVADAVAVALRRLDLAQVIGVTNAIQAAVYASSPVGDVEFSHLNPGMQRMNCGNVIRRALRKSVDPQTVLEMINTWPN